MRFAFTDFFQDGPFRVFSFVKVPQSERGRKYWVKADLNLARRFGISLQELPLLCRDVLEAGPSVADKHIVVYTAEAMQQYAAKCAGIASERKSWSRRRAATGE